MAVMVESDKLAHARGLRTTQSHPPILVARTFISVSVRSDNSAVVFTFSRRLCSAVYVFPCDASFSFGAWMRLDFEQITSSAIHSCRCKQPHIYIGRPTRYRCCEVRVRPESGKHKNLLKIITLNDFQSRKLWLYILSFGRVPWGHVLH